MDRAILVLGPESSGTRLVTQILINGGCEGSADHRQPFDVGNFQAEGPIVWRRSFTHNGNWPDIASLVERVPEPRTVTVVVCIRDALAVSRSQHKMKSGYAATLQESLDTVGFTYRYIFGEINGLRLPYRYSVYEALVLHPEKAQRSLWDSLGLPGGAFVDVRDENLKHYEEPP